MPKYPILEPIIVAGKTLDEWEAQWERVEGGYRVYHLGLQGVIGLHRAVKGNAIVFVGRAIQAKNKGLYTRLQNFLGPPQTSNKHSAANRIRLHKPTLHLEVLRVGDGLDDREAAEIAKELNTYMIARHLPEWNVRKPKPPKK